MSKDTVTLKMSHGELSALSYLVAFAALKHTEGERVLTFHEDALVTKVAQLDPDGYTVWREAVIRAANQALPEQTP